MNVWPAETECPHPMYQDFKKSLNQASHHYADDSTKEWKRGAAQVKKAVEIALEADYPYWAMERMFQEAKSLVTWTQFMHLYITELKKVKGV